MHTFNDPETTGNSPKMCSFYEELGDIFGNSPAIIPVATGYNHRPEHNILHNLRFAATPTTHKTGRHHIEEKDGVNHAEAIDSHQNIFRILQPKKRLNQQSPSTTGKGNSSTRDHLHLRIPSWITNKDLFCRDEIHFTQNGMPKYYIAIKAAILKTRGIGTNKRLGKHNTSHINDDLITTPLASPTTDTVAETLRSKPSTSASLVTMKLPSTPVSTKTVVKCNTVLITSSRKRKTSSEDIKELQAQVLRGQLKEQTLNKPLTAW
ncbi:Hypothetical predicted protein [Mytilus galloprovincialis]|uniref:Uncharacterized protein n=1 Tax=Mytilus galloprovincialis TaxID=29158 RepID=A0A8B6CS59_MYTGA|nr:Hypothetical predicted protein [Mytilus galloprovincialis]